MEAGPLLEDFRVHRQLTYQALAERLGCTRGMAHQLCSGTKRPGLELAVRIERATDGWAKGPIRPWQWVAAKDRVAA